MTSTARPLVSIVMPMYNEVEAAENVTREILRAVDALDDPGAVVVLVVDDGSTDGSGEVLDRLAHEDPRVRVVHHEHNQGFGAAIKTGIASADTTYAFMIPGDGQWDPAELPLFLSAARDGVDLALGVRSKRAMYGRGRQVLSVMYSLMVRALFGVRFRDLAWVHLYHREQLDWRSPPSTSPFYPVEIALCAAAADRSGRSWREIPSTMRVRGGGVSKIARPLVVLRMLRELLSAAVRIRGAQRAR